ncbi:laminaribiose-binding protein /nucleoside-binding protein [Acetivibrio thermocellus AD2]|jgi:basic membrane protein A|uniref:Basic membrane lipoprotein n=2 Tax=Acetivibrio thermocellus TaxID=1515 RepID=A3DFS3_ACET2|nr:BMP family ABC transporter substrate-binding protein [Acetivibrio thermocellus]NLG88922.1 BMP family ABC transporter substrate-binding protein [Clostridiaceae bacterium]ABN52802.1 basic membrane lipoprotein [Acetivibrio thermocellus ATCC 27405]ADU75364.1 basic membrane lipoprotein [Acetivibrio thermocellus DSM 1313]ALX09358.1 basic membrane lipoprotein [Acetivibrio thermocellus AD2]ANV77112.1 basic membrane lipoprotein [Acetivibrio thermocellus DSM 2360]
MKKFLALLLSVIIVFSLTACGGKNSGNNSNNSSNNNSSNNTGGKKIKIGMVTDVGGVNDGSFNQSAWEGLQRAQKELGVEVRYAESATDADYAPNIEAFIDEGYDLIICVGYMLADATRKAAEANPNQKFAIIDDASIDLPNVTCLMFEQSQASYLVGLVAGKMTKTNKVGFVVGMVSQTMNEFGYGYLAGVKDANPNATILQFNANSFSSTETGKSAATTMITNGADVIFHAAGGTGLGVIEGCKDAGKWAIGVDSDQSPLAPENILTSAMKRVDNACFDIAKAVKEGNVKPGIITYDLKSAGVDIAPTTTNLPKEVLDYVNQAKQDIINGKITVPKTKAEFEAKYGNIYELDD